MALRDLTTPTMVTISGAWLNDKTQRATLEKLERVKPLLPDIEAAHAGLLASQKKETPAEAELAELDERATALDRVHDMKARGLFNVMTGLSELLEDESLADSIKRVRDELMPDGLSIITKSYLDEAGEAALVHERISAESKKVLKQVSVGGASLSKWVDAWLRPALELGEVERERVRLRGKVSEESEAGVSAARARNDWIRVVSAMQQMLNLERGLEEATRRSILEHLEDAQRKADRRGGRLKKAGEDDGPAVEDGDL